MIEWRPLTATGRRGGFISITTFAYGRAAAYKAERCQEAALCLLPFFPPFSLYRFLFLLRSWLLLGRQQPLFLGGSYSRLINLVNGIAPSSFFSILISLSEIWRSFMLCQSAASATMRGKESLQSKRPCFLTSSLTRCIPEGPSDLFHSPCLIMNKLKFPEVRMNGPNWDHYCIPAEKNPSGSYTEWCFLTLFSIMCHIKNITWIQLLHIRN